jgi:hypothetical protein
MKWGEKTLPTMKYVFFNDSFLSEEGMKGNYRNSCTIFVTIEQQDWSFTTLREWIYGFQR